MIPGGTGRIGEMLTRSLADAGHEVVVLTRQPRHSGEIGWDGRTLGPWAAAVDGSDVVINLAGRSVNCRYTDANLRQMMDSRVDSARVIGAAIAAARRPPAAWLQMSTATIYAHSLDRPNDEASGEIGGTEPGVPAYWSYSVSIAMNWEQAQASAATPGTRKVALRTAIVMSPERGGAFATLSRLARLGLGGPVGGGRQYMSWIHGADLARAVSFLIARDDIARRGEPGRPVAVAAAGVHARAAEGMGCPRRAPGDAVDGRDRRFRLALGHRAAAQEPLRAARAADRGGLRLRLPGLARRPPPTW